MNTKTILKWALVLSIVVVLNLFFNFAIMAVKPAPEYDKFCVPKQVNIPPETQAQCVAQGGSWNGNVDKGRPTGVGTVVPAGYCDLNFTCNKQFNDAQTVYNRNVFIALVVLGLASLAIGLFV